MILEELRIIATVSLDFYTNNIKTVNVKQYDTHSRFILVSFTEYGRKVALNNETMSAIVRYKKPDGKYGLIDCEIKEDGTVLIELKEQMTVATGKCQADIMVLEGTGLKVESFNDVTSFEDLGYAVLSTMPLYLNVIATPIENAELESEYDFTALNKSLAETKAAEADLIAKHAEWELQENQRQTNEENRQEAESARETAASTAVANANNATTSANAAAESANLAADDANTATAKAETATQTCQTVYETVESNAQTVISECEQARDDANAAAELCQSIIDGARPNWDETDSSSVSYIRNKVPIGNGSGNNAVLIGTGDAQGSYSVAGGTNDKSLIKNLLGSSLLASLTSIDEAKAYGDMSLAFGAGVKAYSAGTIAIGANSTAGCKGFYWTEIDFDTLTITLSTKQRTLLSTSPTWTDEAAAQLSNWASGDVISIVNDSKYTLCSTITSVDSTAGTIIVDSLPFTETEYLVLANFDDYTVFCPSKPSYGVIELGLGAFTLGLQNSAVGSFSHVEGWNNMGAGDFGHAEGRDNVAGYAAHAEGRGTKALGSNSHAEGHGSIAQGVNSHAEGYYTQTLANHCHAEGYYAIAQKSGAHAEGANTIASAYDCHAEGNGSIANGKRSHAEGMETTANGADSHSEGRGTIADGSQQHVQGKWNVADSENKYAHIVGGGASDTERKNIHTLDWNGNAWFPSLSLGGSCDAPSVKLEFDAELAALVISFPESE